MTDYISPFDPRFITLGRAAELIADCNPCTTRNHVMDLLKRAMWHAEFDESGTGSESDADDWLQIEVEIPRAEMTEGQLALKNRPKRLYAMRRWSITSVLFCDRCLPGDQQMIDQTFYTDRECELVYDQMANIPYTDFPPHGRERLDGIFIAQSKLKKWLIDQGYPVPDFLKDTKTYSSSKPDLKIVQPSAEETQPAQDNKCQGRPELPGWSYVKQLVREIKANHPDLQHKQIAYQAHERAKGQFDEKDIPSEATIQRRFKELLQD